MVACTLQVAHVSLSHPQAIPLKKEGESPGTATCLSTGQAQQRATCLWAGQAQERTTVRLEERRC